MTPRSNKSYTVVPGPTQRAPDNRALLTTTDAEFGVVEIVGKDEAVTTIAFRDVVRGKSKWANARVRNNAIKSLRPLGTQGGSEMKALHSPTWAVAKLVRTR